MIHPGGVLKELIGGIKTSVLGDPTLEGRLAVLELDSQLAAAKNLVLLIQKDHRLNAFREVNDGRIPCAHQSPLWAKMGIKGENTLAVGIWTNIKLVNQGVIVWKGTFEGKVFPGNTLDLLLLVLVFPVLNIRFFIDVIDYRPLSTVKTIWAERKGSWWGWEFNEGWIRCRELKVVTKEVSKQKSYDFEVFFQVYVYRYHNTIFTLVDATYHRQSIVKARNCILQRGIFDPTIALFVLLQARDTQFRYTYCKAGEVDQE